MFGTFSRTSHRGPWSRRTRKTSVTSPEWGPAIPAMAPACDRSVHGKPATSTSKGTSIENARTSPCNAVCGKRAWSTRRAGAQISHIAIVSWPSLAKPSSKPPIPENRLTTLSVGNGEGCFWRRLTFERVPPWPELASVVVLRVAAAHSAIPILIQNNTPRPFDPTFRSPPTHGGRSAWNTTSMSVEIGWVTR